MIGVADGRGGYRVAITGIGCNVPDRVLTWGSALLEWKERAAA